MASEYRSIIQQPSDRVIVALDNMNWAEATSVMSEVGPNVGMAKVNSLAVKRGWEYTVNMLDKLGALTMADPKFHDIPKTVELSSEAVAECDATLITVHASGGIKMLEAAVMGRDRAYDNQTVEKWNDIMGGILAITVLTSIDEECESIFGKQPEEKVIEFAQMAQEAGVDGVVCSGKELRAIRAISALDDLITVVPGITPAWAKKANDQKRITTPREALQEGADYIVVGRAITQPPEGISQAEAAQRIAVELAEAS